jgi:hypothetical protein
MQPTLAIKHTIQQPQFINDFILPYYLYHFYDLLNLLFIFIISKLFVRHLIIFIMRYNFHKIIVIIVLDLNFNSMMITK